MRLLFVSSMPFLHWNMGPGNKYAYLAKKFSGDIIAPVLMSHHDIKDLSGAHIENKFTIHPFKLHRISLFRVVLFVIQAVTQSLRLRYIEKIKFEYVISTEPLVAGMVAILISRLIGARSVLEVNGNFEDAFKYEVPDRQKRSSIQRAKGWLAQAMIPISIGQASVVKLLFQGQIDSFLHHRASPLNTFVFADFAAIEKFIDAETMDDKYILLVGYPWYLKGVDILIEAFRKISDQFPDYRLKVVGWCPEGREYFEALAEGNDRIELCDPVPHRKIVSLMAKCSVYVLASRTEAMGRVLLEAMASRKPIVASNVGGVGAIIRDGFNGLLFESENSDELAEKIVLLLRDKEQARRLADNGYTYVQEELSGMKYIERYESMLKTSMA